MSTSFYEDASLVMIPSGYKTSKVYSAKPTTGSGDLDFTRSNDTATRVGPDGLIEKVRTNLAAYSEEFSNAYWTKTTTTITDNTAANPINGATTADTLTRTGGLSGFLRRQIAQTGITTFSVFAKSGSTNLVRLNVYDGSTDRGATYNLTTGAITTIYGSPLFTLAQDFGSGWYRISIAVNAASYSDCQVHLDSVNSVIIFGAQLETGDIATDYIATTTAAVSVGPVANVPRLDYLNSSCPRLLLEPQRTNLITFSEQIDNAAYSKLNTTVTSNATTSPTGYQDADKIIANTTNGVHNVSQSFSIGSSTAYTASIYAKKGEYSGLRINFTSSANTFVSVNLNTGVIQSFGGSIYLSSSITSVGNDWYLVTMSFLPPIVSSSLNFIIENPVGTASFAGDNTSGIFLWGAQLEVGAYATSYIPTLGAAVTRGADAASKTGISSLIGQTQGTLFAEFNVLNINPANVSRIILSDGTTNNYIFLGINEAGSGNLCRLFINNTAASFSLSLFSSTAITVGRHKLALAYKSGSFALYLDGNSVASSATTGTIPATSQLVIGGTSPSAVSNLETLTMLQNILFKTRLENDDLASLTSL